MHFINKKNECAAVTDKQAGLEKRRQAAHTVRGRASDLHQMLPIVVNATAQRQTPHPPSTERTSKHVSAF